MRQSKIIMGMTVVVEIVDAQAQQEDFDAIFNYFQAIDNRFSTYKQDSEISQINQGLLEPADYSEEMKEVLSLAEKTKIDSGGYFNIVNPQNKIDPSGLVKGWAINNAANMLKKQGFNNFFISAGGDIQAYGQNSKGQPWTVGIQNPFNPVEIIKSIKIKNKGVATSGSYVHRQHIYNPKNKEAVINDIISLTVIGPNIYEADRFATAAFAMGSKGIAFIESQPNLEGYMVFSNKMATMTSNFNLLL